MPVQSPQLSIKKALESFDNERFRASNLAILNALGYSSGRTLESSDTTPETFRGHIKSHATKELNEQKAKFADWKQADILFQLTDKELNGQGTLLDNTDITPSLSRSYLFFAIELSGAYYSRTDLANIARQINRLFPMPVMVIFSYSHKLSFAIINRRRNKREDRDVLGKVTLIYAINYVKPHRGHLDILDSLSISNLRRDGPINNFDSLHDAWEKIFNVELLNKRFYRELSNWYFWAMEQVEFPDDIEKHRETRNATSLIRLLARLIFCWFIKEKGLIPDNLFQEDKLRSVLNNLERDESTFYHAILQNLFFATLNQRMNTAKETNRKFATDEGYPKNSNTYGVKNLYRYEALFNNPQDVLALFEDIPFLNGGLFECLDKEDKAGKVQYLDGFSRNPKKRPKVPNELFFGDKRPINLSDIYGDENRRRECVRGLIRILGDYKFTIVENTPIEQEIALDPELLGQVFEGLLASYNPETKTTARKQTGSFYTPRPIVEYMVDESIKAYLIEATKAKIGEKNAKEGLEILFTYTEHEHAFNDDEVDILLEAIHSCKILDPACGSGAFPMGILQKLVYIIHKLDPDNAKWKKLQIDKANEIPDLSARNVAIKAINQDFEENEDDYGRKLYLIRNCLYGVDIQPIAIQISKLRFFISLVCDQQQVSIDNAKNRGIRSLPNLETKFIAANTLIGLDETDQLELFANPKVEKLERELESIAEDHFSADSREDRLKLQKRDRELRGEMVKELEKTIANQETSQKLAEYDRYDPQASTTFFDPRWMFGQSVANGFDIVIGNPPYGIKLTKEEQNHLDYMFPKNKPRAKNSAIYFHYKTTFQLLRKDGIQAYIVPKSLCYSSGWNKCAELVVHGLLKLIDTGKAFKEVKLEQAIFIRSNITHKPKCYVTGIYDGIKVNELVEAKVDIFENNRVLLTGLTSEEMKLIDRILKTFSSRWGDYVVIERGLNWQSEASKERGTGAMPIYRGAQLSPYFVDEPKDFINLDKFNREKYEPQYNPKILNQLAIAHVQNPYPHFYLQAALDVENKLVFDTVSCTYAKNSMIDIQFLLGINNSKLFAWLLYKFVYSNAVRSTRYDGRYVSMVPCPDFKKIDQKPITQTVNAILSEIRSNNHLQKQGKIAALKSEIDQMVYQLYGLTSEEIMLIEGER